MSSKTKNIKEDKGKTIPGFSHYKITKDGKVYSKYKKSFLKNQINVSGYFTIEIKNDNKKKVQMQVSNLLALAYLPNSENKPVVAFKDSDRTNLNINNIMWATREEIQNLSEKNKKAKTNEKAVNQYDMEGNFIQTFPSLLAAAKAVNKKKCQHISYVCNKTQNRTSAYGFKWAFVEDVIKNETSKSESQTHNDANETKSNDKNKTKLNDFEKDTNLEKEIPNTTNKSNEFSTNKFGKLEDTRKHFGRRRPVRQINLKTGEIRSFISAQEAAKITGTEKSNITQVCRGNRPQAEGCRWEYTFEELEKPPHKLDIETKDWKVHPKYTNYKISKDGQVYSIKRKIILKQHTKSKYPKVSLSINGKDKDLFVHRLVAACYIEEGNEKPTVNHKNGIKTDSNVENLEYATYVENTDHAIKTGLRQYNGMKVRQVDENGKEKKIFNSVAEAAKKLNISERGIYDVINGKYQTIYGHRFEKMNDKKNNSLSYFLNKTGEKIYYVNINGLYYQANKDGYLILTIKS